MNCGYHSPGRCTDACFDDVEMEPQCASCREYVSRCDCLRCEGCECLVRVPVEGSLSAWNFSRVTPAVVCCSSDCLLSLGQRRRLKVTQGMDVFDPRKEQRK